MSDDKLVAEIDACMPPDYLPLRLEHALLKRARDRLTALQSELAQATARAEQAQSALRQIVDWNMPPTGRFHDDGKEMSYGWCYGSNGERDYIRGIARAALASGTGAK